MNNVTYRTIFLKRPAYYAIIVKAYLHVKNLKLGPWNTVLEDLRNLKKNTVLCEKKYFSEPKNKRLDQKFKFLTENQPKAKIQFVLIFENYFLLYSLPKKWWSCDYFYFSASEALQNCISNSKPKRSKLKVCLKN